MDFPRRVFDGEGVRADVDFGPTLMLNRNRCILCTRCIALHARGRRRRADRHRRSRQRQRDRDLQRTGRALDSVGQSRWTSARSARSRRGSIASARARGTTRTPSIRSARCARRAATPPAWIKAKPEWAKGSRLIRVTPRYNPDGQRLLDVRHRPLPVHLGRRRAAAAQAARSLGQGRRAAGRDVEGRARPACAISSTPPAGAIPASVRFLSSAHASHEELFLLKQLAEGMKGDAGAESRARHVAAVGKAAAARDEVPRAGHRCAERQRRTGSRLDRRRWQRRRAGSVGAAHGCRAGGDRACSTSSIPVPTDRSAT